MKNYFFNNFVAIKYMELYIDKDLEIFKKEKDNIDKEHKKAKLKYIEPTKDEKKKVTEIIYNYIKKNKRKIYGGIALNLLIKNKSKNDAFYKDDDYPDIEFYSPEPIVDAINICNELYNNKIKRIRTIEAQHAETYTISINTEKNCDISYMFKQLYNILPTKSIDGFEIVHPHFLEIDYLRQMNDPLVSYFRLEKFFPRFFLLQQFYPLPHINKTLHELKIENNDVMEDIRIWLDKKNTVITVGQYAFNYFMMKSTIEKKEFKYTPVSIYEIISIDYKNDVVNLVKQLQKKYSNVTITEHYPFFQFLGYSTYVFFGDKLIAKIYDKNNRCIPYIKIPLYKFNNESFEKEKGEIQIGTFSLVLMYALIQIIRSKLDKDKLIFDYYTIMASQLVEMRRYFLNKTKKTILDDTDFKDFQINCIGYELSPAIERAIKIEKRKAKGKQPLSYTYNPEDGLKEPVSDYKFANSSGNIIKDEKKLKIK